MILVSIDPGIKGMSLAAFRDGQLERVELLRAPPRATFARADTWSTARLIDLGPVDLCVVERMVHYPGSTGARGNAVANDLIDLTAASCLLAGRINPRELRFVTPHEWKGTTPKEICEARALAKLREKERQLLWAYLADVPPSLRHNLWDALGIGLFALGR